MLGALHHVSSPHVFVKSSFNELVFNVSYLFFIMYKSHRESGWLRRVQHAKGRKKRKKQKQESFCYGRAERKKERNKQGHSANES